MLAIDRSQCFESNGSRVQNIPSLPCPGIGSPSALLACQSTEVSALLLAVLGPAASSAGNADRIRDHDRRALHRSPASIAASFAVRKRPGYAATATAAAQC